MSNNFSQAVEKEPAQPKILRLPQVKLRIGISRSGIYDKLNTRSKRHDATFPKPIKLGGHAIGWLEQEITDWLQSRIEKSRDGKSV